MRRLSPGNRGASPVIGVILMVAVTVILVAVIGTFVLDIGGDQTTVPNAKFSFDYNSSGNLTIAHEGGKTIDEKNSLKLTIEYTNATGTVTERWPVPVTSGDTFTLNSVPKEGTEVRVIWEGPDGDSSDVLASDRVP